MLKLETSYSSNFQAESKLVCHLELRQRPCLCQMLFLFDELTHLQNLKCVVRFYFILRFFKTKHIYLVQCIPGRGSRNIITYIRNSIREKLSMVKTLKESDKRL